MLVCSGVGRGACLWCLSCGAGAHFDAGPSAVPGACLWCLSVVLVQVLPAVCGAAGAFPWQHGQVLSCMPPKKADTNALVARFHASDDPFRAPPAPPPAELQKRSLALASGSDPKKLKSASEAAGVVEGGVLTVPYEHTGVSFCIYVGLWLSVVAYLSVPCEHA